MNIGICGKENTDMMQIMQILQEYADMASMKLELSYFLEKEELLEAVKQKNNIDVVFLEIESDFKESISMASSINVEYPECQIVFYSKSLQYATEVYGTVHTYFVLKDELPKRVEEIFRRILEEQKEKQKRIQLSVIGGTKLILSPEEIIYFERTKRITRVVSIYGIYEIRDKLDDVMTKILPKDFFRCHNSYIIGISSIREITKNHFIMVNGDSVTISRSYKKLAEKMFWE